MKKLKIISLLFIISLVLTGCMKYNIKMDIKKDKSMDFSILLALDKSLYDSSDNSEIMDKKQLEELKKKGYTVKDYTDDNMKGFTITKTFKNIDEISTTEDKEFDLSKFLSDENKDNDEKLFKIKKGIFKNKYTAKFKMSSNSLTNNNDDNDSISSREETDWDDLSKLSQSMELTYQVKLPYKSLNNNATSTKDNEKELTWDLTKMKNESTINFEFELYNYTYIIIASIIALAVVLFTISNILNKTKPVPTTNISTNNIVEEKKEQEPVNNIEPPKEETSTPKETNENKESLQDFYNNQ